MEEAPPPAKEAFNEKRPRYPWQRQSLKAACPELHISDCKLLLTASLPSLQLTFLTKGHLLTSTPCFLGCVEPGARRDGTSEYSAAQGHRPGPCRGEKRPLMPACRANLPREGAQGGRVFKTNINLSGKRQYWAKTKCQGLLATTPGFPPPHPTPSSSSPAIHFYLKILTAHNTY